MALIPNNVHLVILINDVGEKVLFVDFDHLEIQSVEYVLDKGRYLFSVDRLREKINKPNPPDTENGDE